MSRRNLALLFIAIGISLLCYGRGEQNPFARIVGLGYQEIDRLALEEPTDDELLTGAMRGMVDVLNERGDEHSVYFDAQAAKPFLAEMQQEFGGVGVRLRLLGEPAKLTVVGPPEPGAPADRAGLRPATISSRSTAMPPPASRWKTSSPKCAARWAKRSRCWCKPALTLRDR